MGVANGPAVFQELMSKVQGFIGKDVVFPFIDDMITATDEYDEHMSKLRAILQVLRGVGLTIRLNKSRFFMRQIEFLGFTISSSGIRPGTAKLQAVENFPRPSSEHDVRRFLGLAGFFRKGPARISIERSAPRRGFRYLCWESVRGDKVHL